MSAPPSTFAALIRQQMNAAFRLLESVIRDVSPEHLHWHPGGNANPIGAIYAHVLLFKDGIINGLFRGGTPLFATEWAGKTGASELPPMPSPDNHGLPDWHDWAQQVQVDLPAMRAYAKAVYESVDSYMAALTDEELQASAPFGMPGWTLGDALTQAILVDIYLHCGEIACLKGIQGGQGYPF